MSDAAVYDLAAVVAERDALKAEVAKLKTENGRLTDVLLSKHGGEPLQLMDELDDARAEVAKLRAACAAKDAALSKALGYVDLDNDALISKCLAALKGTAGTGWIDATGAVEGKIELALDREGSPEHAYVICFPPYDWSGRTVLVMVKP